MVWDYHFQFEAIGTAWIIEFKKTRKSKPDSLIKKIHQEINEFTLFFSRFEPNSAISKFVKSPGSLEIPEKYLPLINLYKELFDSTDGLFTPLVGNLLTESGYDESYSLTQKKLNPVLSWDEVLEYKAPVLEVKKPWVLDFGAAGKGFLVDLVARILDEEEIDSYCIDAGGDIFYKTAEDEKLKVGLENPLNFQQVLGISEIKNESICGSSGNRRKWGDFHHIFNPEKLESVKEVLAVWVVAENAGLADGLSTCLFFTDPEKLSAKFKFEYLIIYPEFTFKKSKGFPGEIYCDHIPK